MGWVLQRYLCPVLLQLDGPHTESVYKCTPGYVFDRQSLRPMRRRLLDNCSLESVGGVTRKLLEFGQPSDHKSKHLAPDQQLDHGCGILGSLSNNRRSVLNPVGML
jgi:hypothetical protein